MGKSIWKAPLMRLGRVRTSARTYEFHVPEPLGGWAICTVNDTTGELLIMSDWGNWNHMWSSNPAHLGAPNLTAFIADRNAVDYLASKLNVGNGPRYGEEFDADATTRVLCKVVCKWRLACGREAIELARDNEETLAESERRLDNRQQAPYFRYDPKDPLYRCDDVKRWFTKDASRSLYDDIRNLADIGSDQLFLERFYRVLDDHDATGLFPDAYEDLVWSQTHADRVLRESILPALIEACRQTTISAMLVAANGPQPAIEASC
ncbi:MAG TPA: hypothetical protein VFD36_20530 [Kofleriaceae bacterium]|nr:hypothetical protein [Kofleriaceae bacterium]